MNHTFHDRILGLAERLVREHPHGRDILALVLDGADHETLEVRLEDRDVRTGPGGDDVRSAEDQRPAR